MKTTREKRAGLRAVLELDPSGCVSWQVALNLLDDLDTLVKQVEEMRKALEKIAGHSHLSVARQIVEEHRRIADDALAALEKEI